MRKTIWSKMMMMGPYGSFYVNGILTEEDQIRVDIEVSFVKTFKDNKMDLAYQRINSRLCQSKEEALQILKDMEDIKIVPV